MIIASRDTSVSHSRFTEWLNRERDNRTTGFWNELSDEVHGRSMTDRVTLLLIELYYANRTTLTGYAVFSNLNHKRPRLFLFNAEGEPVYYNEADTEFILTITEAGEVTEFTAGEHIPIFDADNAPVGSVYLHLENNWGTYLPVLHVEVGSSPFGAGLVDVLYENRESGSYKVLVDPDENALKYQVQNVTPQLLDLTIPIFPNYHLPFRLAPWQSAWVPSTDHSREYIKDLLAQGVVKVSEPIAR